MASTRRTRRRMADNISAAEPSSKSSKATSLNPTLLLLEIPADTNTSLPVWEAMRSKQVDIAWKVNPYSVSVHLTPVTGRQKRGTTCSKRESMTAVAQTSALSSSVLQPQMVIQSIDQEHAASQNASRVLLTFSQNPQSPPCSPGHREETPPTPNSATSLIVALPVIITQPAHQPSTPTPTSTPTERQAQSKVPAPSLFHTKSSCDIPICDSFLLGLCRSGKRCKMHHTPYPFHWQLWRVTTHRWVDVSLRCQVLLERIYSDVTRDVICLKDGQDRHILNFDTMELDDPSKYDGVRRLTNCDSLVENCYFPSKWRMYWWNNSTWEEYDEDVSALLLKKMSKKEPECSFYIGSQEYKMDFATMTQTNVTTRFHRDVRCRPVFRSPDSMQPYLQTGVQSDSSQPAGDPPAAHFSVDPVEEFSSWYPPVWCQATEQNYSLVDVPAGTRAHRRVQQLFYESMPESKADIISIQQVQNLLHWDKYQRHKAYMQQLHTRSKELLERHLFHGTTREASQEICYNNFDPRVAGIHGNSYGFGTYFATRASLSDAYSSKVGADEVRHMFLAKVLVGKVSLGRTNYRRPPPLSSKMKLRRLHDACVDNMSSPTMFVVFDSCQCYPYYLIKYKDLPTEIDM